MTTFIHQPNLHAVKVETRGSETRISQQTYKTGNVQYVEIAVELDVLPELVSALQETLDFLRPPATVPPEYPESPLRNPNQGQLFDPADYT